MASLSKANFIKKTTGQLKKRYGSSGRRESLAMLEQIILAILAEGTTTAKANNVFRRLKEDYFDWNEVRVSAVVELQEIMAELPESEQRSLRLKRILKYIFESTYSFDVDEWRKLTMKEVAKRLDDFPVASQYLTARVIRDGMGGGAVPLDDEALRVYRRLELFDRDTTPLTMAASLERAIPKAKNFEFCQLIAELAADTCLEPEPRCKQCCLLDSCPTGKRYQVQLAEQASKTTARRAPRKKAVSKLKVSRLKKRK